MRVIRSEVGVATRADVVSEVVWLLGSETYRADAEAKAVDLPAECDAAEGRRAALRIEHEILADHDLL